MNKTIYCYNCGVELQQILKERVGEMYSCTQCRMDYERRHSLQLFWKQAKMLGDSSGRSRILIQRRREYSRQWSERVNQLSNTGLKKLYGRLMDLIERERQENNRFSVVYRIAARLTTIRQVELYRDPERLKRLGLYSYVKGGEKNGRRT